MTPEARPPVPGPSPARPLFTLTKDRTVLGLVLLVALALHGSAVRLPFFADDFLFLDQVRHRSLLAVLSAQDPIGNFFRPFGRQLYFWVLSHLTAQSAVAFHVANLGLFLAILALFFQLTRRLAGLSTAAVATSLLALSYAADVPVLWASGSQDLIAVTFALASLWLLVRGRGAWAALSLFLALLSKETVVLTPLIGILVGRRREEPWRDSARRAWPLFAGAAAWAVLYVAMANRHRGGAEFGKDPSVVLAALIHLVQVVLGAEWRVDAKWQILRTLPPLIPIVIAAFAIWEVGEEARPKSAAPKPGARKGRAREGQGRAAKSAAPGAGAVAGGAGAQAPAGPALETQDRKLAMLTGGAWALAGALPVAAVASIWSAYFYLWALCGTCLVLGALASRWPRWQAIALVALLAWGSENGRRLDEFYTGPNAWCVESHVNRFYLDRAMSRISRYLRQLKRVHPTVPPRSTFFYNGVPSFVAWQVADGPLTRWAYGDSSLRAYFLSEFSLQKSQRGPVYFIQFSADSVQERSHSPRFYKEMMIAMVLVDKYDPALACLTLDLQRDSSDVISKYWLALVRRARGDTTGEARLLYEAHLHPRAGPSPDVRLAKARLAAGDSLGARELALKAVTDYTLDPQAHAVLADVMMSEIGKNASGVMEALAHRVLAPGDPLAWRRWGYVQAYSKRYIEGYESLQHYFAIGGAAAAADTAARSWRDELRRVQPGGELIQKGLRAGRGAANP